MSGIHPSPRNRYETVVIGLEPGPVTAESGLRLLPDGTLDETPELDTLVVPVGCGPRRPEINAAVAGWLRRLPARRRLAGQDRAGVGDPGRGGEGLDQPSRGLQAGEVMGVETHVKDTARFKGGWAFFGFDGALSGPSTQTPYAAADTTFVQFYPTLPPDATRLKALSAAYPSDPEPAAAAK